MSDQQGGGFSFDKLGWWAVPVGALVGLLAPIVIVLKSRTGRKALSGGLLSSLADAPMLIAGSMLTGALAAALLVAKSRVKNRGARLAIMVIGVPVLAILAVVILASATW